MPKAEDRLARGFLIAGRISAMVALMGWLAALFNYLSNGARTELGNWTFLVGVICGTLTVTFLLLSWLYRKRLLSAYDAGCSLPHVWVVGDQTSNGETL